MALDNRGKEIIFEDLDSYSVDKQGTSCQLCRHYFNHLFPDNEPCISCSRCSKFEPIAAAGAARGEIIKDMEEVMKTFQTAPKPGTIVHTDDTVTPRITLTELVEDQAQWTEVDLEVDLVNHPPHYTSHPSGVECITITEHMCFNIGNAVKYAWRADLKWDRTEDIKKAIWYLERELKRERKVKDE